MKNLLSGQAYNSNPPSIREVYNKISLDYRSIKGDLDAENNIRTEFAKKLDQSQKAIMHCAINERDIDVIKLLINSVANNQIKVKLLEIVINKINSTEEKDRRDIDIAKIFNGSIVAEKNSSQLIIDFRKKYYVDLDFDYSVAEAKEDDVTSMHPNGDNLDSRKKYYMDLDPSFDYSVTEAKEDDVTSTHPNGDTHARTVISVKEELVEKRRNGSDSIDQPDMAAGGGSIPSLSPHHANGGKVAKVKEGVLAGGSEKVVQQPAPASQPKSIEAKINTFGDLYEIWKQRKHNGDPLRKLDMDSDKNKKIINKGLLWALDNYRSLDKNRYEFITILINKSADVNAVDKNGNTLLHWVINNKQLASEPHHCCEFITMLIDKGADVDAVNKDGDTPLHISGFGAKAITLLKGGCNPTLKNKLGKTAIDLHPISFVSKQVLSILADRSYEVRSEIIRLLSINKDRYPELNINIMNVLSFLQRASDPVPPAPKLDSSNSEAKAGGGSLCPSASPEDIFYLCKNNPDLADAELKEKSHDFHVRVMKIAIDNKNMKVINLLIKCGVNINKVDSYGIGPMHIATENLRKAFLDKKKYQEDVNAYKTIINLLISNGADINIGREKGNAPLLTSVQFGVMYPNFKAAKFLIECGADVNVLDENKKSLLHKITSVTNMGDDHVKIIEVIMTKKPKLNLLDENGQAPLHYVALNGNTYDDHQHIIRPKVAKILIKNGASVNFKNKEGKSFFDWVVFKTAAWYRDIIDFCIDYGANINPKDDKDISPLHIAIKGSNVATSLLLITRGANIDVLDQGGNTPLNRVAQKYIQSHQLYRPLILRLLDAGANPELANSNGKTASYYLKRHNFAFPATPATNVMITAGGGAASLSSSFHSDGAKTDAINVKKGPVQASSWAEVLEERRKRSDADMPIMSAAGGSASSSSSRSDDAKTDAIKVKEEPARASNWVEVVVGERRKRSDSIEQQSSSYVRRVVVKREANSDLPEQSRSRS